MEWYINAILYLFFFVILSVVLIFIVLAHRETIVSCQKIPNKSGALCTIEKNYYFLPNKMITKHIYHIEASGIRDGQDSCSIDIKTPTGVDSETFGDMDFQHFWLCKLNAEGRKFSNYLSYGAGSAVFRSNQIFWSGLFLFLVLFLVNFVIVYHYKNIVMAMRINNKKRTIRIYRIMDFKRGFYRDYKFSEFMPLKWLWKRVMKLKHILRLSIIHIMSQMKSLRYYLIKIYRCFISI